MTECENENCGKVATVRTWDDINARFIHYCDEHAGMYIQVLEALGHHPLFERLQ